MLSWVGNQPELSLMIKLIVLVGPTGVGKTDISIQLAEKLSGEIISADSRLFYRGMDIGTAKPTQAQRKIVPHHLIDVANPDETWSLALFQERARRAIEEIHEKGHLPFLVGGTGQYVRAVTQGWDIPKVEPDPRLRAVLEKWAKEIGQEGLHQRLAALDPAAAQGIDPRNLRRCVRALEVILGTGRRFSDQRQRSPSPYQVLMLGLTLPRQELYARIDERVDNMIKAGLVGEVQNLLDQGFTPDLPTMSAIGYSEVVNYLRGEYNLEEAVKKIKWRTHAFVRRQANWFKPDDPNIRWFHAGEDALSRIEEAISRFMVDSDSSPVELPE
jgi:tRNA dimethylallyltransferase